MQAISSKELEFRLKLDVWSQENNRDFPWKVRDPYKIWVSEIILQQTTTRQGLPYYKRFIKAFPNIERLAEAQESKLYKVWEGLGYYSRLRNMMITAQKIVSDHDGVFPKSYDELLSYKGIGPYTASAICSFSWDMPYPAVDGNFVRIISRLYGIHDPFDNKHRKKYTALAFQLMGDTTSSIFNQSMMDFGALQCIPSNPKCESCPMTMICSANVQGIVHQLPAKKKRKTKKERFFIQIVLIDKDKKTVIRQRKGNDIWKGLNEFQSYEVGHFDSEEENKIIGEVCDQFNIECSDYVYSGQMKQSLTHQIIHSKYIIVRTNDVLDTFSNHYNLVDCQNLCNFAFPKSTEVFINRELQYLLDET